MTTRSAMAPAVGVAPAETAPVSRRARFGIYAAVLLAFFDNFALLPLVAPRAQELGADALAVGAIVAAYSLTNLTLNLVGGSLTDRIGRRTVLLLSLAVAPLCIAGYGLVSDVSMFLAVRVIHGAFGGFLMAALFALLADVAPPGQRGRTIGRAGALIGVAAVVGPASAGLLAAQLGSTTAFLVVAGLLAVGLLAVWWTVPETLPAGERTTSEPGVWRRLLSEPRLRAAYLAIFGLEAGVGVVTGFLKDGIVERQVALGMETERALRYAAGAQGGLFSIFALVAVLLMLSPTARWVDRRGVVGPAMAGLVVLAVSTALMAQRLSLTSDAIAMVLYGVGFGLLFPAATAMVGIATAAPERGRAYGLFNVSFDAGLATGPLLAGALAASAAGLDPFATITVLIATVAILVPLAGSSRSAASLPAASPPT